MSASTTSAIKDNAVPRANWQSRVALVVLVGYWLALITATHIPKVSEPLGFRGSDKVVHLAAYAILAVLVGVAWSLRWGLSWRAAAAMFAVLAAHGALDELTQPLFSRHADWYDWYADTLGSALGLVALVTVLELWRGTRTSR